MSKKQKKAVERLLGNIKAVVWEDAYGCPAGWQFADDVERGSSVVCSVGVVLSETDGLLTIAPHTGGLNRDSRQYAGVITIPKRQIISVFCGRELVSKRKRQEIWPLW